MQWRGQVIYALDYQAADEAIACAIGKGWLIGEGKPPHSICFTNECRGLSATSKRAR
jgi:hypothetical protein